MKRILSRMIALLLTFCMFMTLIPSNVFAENGNNTSPSSIYDQGDGSSENPFVVSTKEQLDAIRDFPDYCYLQGNDIDLSDSEWTPIGNEDSEFNGTYDGNNFTLNGLTITSTDNSIFGLFGITSADSQLKNINLTNVNIDLKFKEGWIYILCGSLVGAAGGKIEYCTSKGNINITTEKDYQFNIGGIAGTGYNIKFCTNETNINVNCLPSDSYTPASDCRIGGITGDGNPQYAMNTGLINYRGRDDVYCGGISGSSSDEISNTINYGDIFAECIDMITSGGSPDIAVGGVVGEARNDIQNSINYGSVSSIGSDPSSKSISSFGAKYIWSSAGGILGYADYDGKNYFRLNNLFNFGSDIVAQTNYEEDSIQKISNGDTGRIVGIAHDYFGGLGDGWEKNATDNYSLSTTKLNGDIITDPANTSTDYFYNGTSLDVDELEEKSESLKQEILSNIKKIPESNQSTGFKADRDGWILTNTHAAFGYSQDKDKSSLYQKLYPDSWEEINPTDITEKWEGNCGGLAALSILNYNNQINLKGLFENPDGSLYKYGQTGKAIYSKDLDFNTYTIKENQNVIDVIEKAQVLQNTYEFEDCRVFKGKNLRDGIIQYYLDGNKQPLYIGMDCKYKINDDDDEYRNFSHAIVTDTSKEIVEPTDQDPCYYIKIYDCIYPYSDSRGGRFSSDIKENPERLISQYFKNMWLRLDPENDEWQEVYRDSNGQFKTVDFDIHISESQSLDAGYGIQSLRFYDLSATDKFNLILEENPGKFTKRITTLDKSLYIASRLVIKAGKFAIKTTKKTLVETDPACNLIFSVFEGGLNLLSENTGDSSAYTFDLEKHKDYNIEGDQFTLTLYGEDMSIGIESDGKNEFNVDLEGGSITVIPEDHSKVSVNIQRKLGSDYKAVSVNSSDLNSEVTLKFSSDGQVEVENQESNPVELSYLINHVAVTQDEFESSDYSLSDQAKELIEAIDKEDINTLQKEDSERIQNLLDQYAALSDEDKALIPEETKNQAAALTEWLNKLNDVSTPSDPTESEDPAEPSDSEDPVDPGTQENPSNSSGSQSSGTKDPVSTPGLNNQDGTQKIDTVSQSVSQKIEPTYRMAPGTGISDNTIIGWMIVLTAVLAAGTISHFSKRRFDSKN